MANYHRNFSTVCQSTVRLPVKRGKSHWQSVFLKTYPNRNPLLTTEIIYIMKKSLLLLVSVLTVLTGLNAQTPERLHCFTDEMYRESIAQDPSVLKTREDLEAYTRQFVAHRNVQRTNGGPAVYIIPVVFHVLHEYGNENISDAQIMDCIMNMNRDFRKQNSDTINIVSAFQAVAADAQIEFRLATLDPNGNCTNGIDRIYTAKTNSANNSSKLNPWPNDMYLNIWTAKTLENTGAAAYAHLPGTVSGIYDGIMSRYDYIGTIGAGGPAGLHTISHEAGHHFNLLHPWGSTNSPGVACGDDFVGDTPETQGWTSCNLSGSICNPPVIENVQNFMEYSYCDCMYTFDQRDRMHATLNSSVAGRNNLWTTQNLSATGTLNPPTASLCAPIADFWTTTQAICEGRSITYKDYSWNGDVAQYNWIFPGGNPATSTDSMPVVTYNTAGIYDVTLIVSNANGSDTMVRTGFVRVNNTIGNLTPMLTSFDQAADLPGTEGWINNLDAGTTTWTRITTTGANGTTNCIRINNYTNTAGQTDEWITPSYDISNLTSARFRFYVANAQRNSTSADLLRVFTSTNCGESWTPRYTKQGATLATAGIKATSFTPTATEWRLDTFNLTGLAPRTNVRFKFQNISDRGNNTYIDEVQITGTPNNVDEVDEVTTGFSLFPNPTSSATTIQFKLNSTQSVQVRIHDITGRLLNEIVNETLNADIHEYPATFPSPGIYLIDVIVGGKHHIRRLVVSE